MAYNSVCVVLLIFVCLAKLSVGQYAVPEIKFEAFTPKGLRVSIPADKGVELFAFHGKLNKDILQIEPGEFSEDVMKPSKGRFTYINPSIKLKEGDVIHYWVFVQHEQLGFRKDDQKWTVDKLLPASTIDTEDCVKSISKVKGKGALCSGEDILNYRFTESTINPQIWLIEQYFAQEPDWEYVIYKNEPDVINVENNVLRIMPKLVAENAMNKRLVVEGCTRPGKQQACEQSFFAIYLSPIVSGRIVSKDQFSFGTITVKAKLPQGDWIFPEIYLEDANDANRRIILAYARGNKILTGTDGNDIGGKLLFGGPYKSVMEPERSRYLSTHKSEKLIGDDWHIFTVKWSKEQLELSIDDVKYGVINSEALQATGFNKETMVRLVIGVGAGGPFDFPDGYTSSSGLKPWKSFSKTAVKEFFLSRDQWYRTWNGNHQLLVEYVHVQAL